MWKGFSSRGGLTIQLSRTTVSNFCQLWPLRLPFREKLAFLSGTSFPLSTLPCTLFFIALRSFLWLLPRMTTSSVSPYAVLNVKRQSQFFWCETFFFFFSLLVAAGISCCGCVTPVCLCGHSASSDVCLCQAVYCFLPTKIHTLMFQDKRR